MLESTILQLDVKVYRPVQPSCVLVLDNDAPIDILQDITAENMAKGTSVSQRGCQPWCLPFEDKGFPSEKKPELWK